MFIVHLENLEKHVRAHACAHAHTHTLPIILSPEITTVHILCVFQIILFSFLSSPLSFLLPSSLNVNGGAYFPFGSATAPFPTGGRALWYGWCRQCGAHLGQQAIMGLELCLGMCNFGI